MEFPQDPALYNFQGHIRFPTMFAIVSHFHPSLRFEGKPDGGVHYMWATVLLANTTLGCE